MKVIEMRELVIDLRGSDERAGSTTFALILDELFKEYNVRCELDSKNYYSKNNKNKGDRTNLKVPVSDNLEELLSFYRERDVSIKILSEKE